MEYLWSTRDSLEQKYIDMLARNVSACSYVNFCPCLECYRDPVWQAYDGIDPSTVGAWLRPNSVSQKEQTRQTLNPEGKKTSKPSFSKSEL